MHATIQKPIEEIVSHIRAGEKVFVVGCNNCAWKCHSGGEAETKAMAGRLARRGVDVVGYTVPGPQGMSLCKLDHTQKVLTQDYADQVREADSFLVLGCGQGVHTVITPPTAAWCIRGVTRSSGEKPFQPRISKSSAHCAANA